MLNLVNFDSRIAFRNKVLLFAAIAFRFQEVRRWKMNPRQFTPQVPMPHEGSDIKD
jgi:hypothetical protein